MDVDCAVVIGGDGNLILAARELLQREEEQVKVTARLPESLSAPVSEGEQVGEVVYTLDDQQIAVYPVYTAGTVEEIDFSWCFGQIADRFF